MIEIYHYYINNLEKIFSKTQTWKWFFTNNFLAVQFCTLVV